MVLSIVDDVFESVSGVPLMVVECSGMYVSSMAYNMPVEGNCTESVTLVGNEKRWSVGGATLYGTAFTGEIFDNTDAPIGSGGVQRRENVVMGTSQSKFPTDIPRIVSSGYNQVVNGECLVHFQNISISADLGRDELFELGKKNPYHRFVNFPVEVTSDFEILATSGDFVNADSTIDNLSNQTVFIKLTEGTNIDAGTTNKLSNVSYGGGDAGGGNATITYSYSGFNNLTITHPQSP